MHMTMDIILNIDHKTVFGEELVLNVMTDRGRPGQAVTPYRMATKDGLRWTCDLRMDLKAGTMVEYYYSVTCGKDNVTRREWRTMPHRLEINALNCEDFVVYDRWISLPEDSYQYSSAFTDCLRPRKIAPVPLSEFDRTIRIKVRAPQLRSFERLYLVGNDRVLGFWDPRKGIPMYEHNHNEWVADIDADELRLDGFEYKFVAIGREKGKPESVLWEDRFNRSMSAMGPMPGGIVVHEVETALFPICNMRCAGTMVPVFSLRSRRSFGVGDFGDLGKMVDWVALTRQRILQVLPVNDTTMSHTWTDSYPYCAISIFALHPQYADLDALPGIADRESRERFEGLRKELNALPALDYERVNKAKGEYLRALYAQEGKAMMATDEFRDFFAGNSSWLVPYAQYSYLRDKHGTADFHKWKDHQRFDEGDRERLSNPRSKAYRQVAFHYFVQFILHSQLAAVHDHARNSGVILKGDIPIGVSRQGCDVWQEPRYFNLDGQAGAPPDEFSRNGQNWGFPTYNWEEMLKDGCRWWERRFASMSRFFDAYRIDHVLGFFRIWEIPIDAVHGLLGQFVPSLGMSREEIEAYGLRFQEELFTEPFITDWSLERMFGDGAWRVKQSYLRPTHDGRYALRDEYSTQRRIEEAFQGRTDRESTDLRDGLYALVSDVLFVRDRNDPNKFHPRIAVQYDFIYEALYDSDKQVFDRIYNDYYYRRNNNFWYREAMAKLPRIIEATRMLTCAEDLGMVPECVGWAMDNLRILSLELQSMPKDTSVRFGRLEGNPYRSVCTISSHDTPTLRGWWDEDHERTQDYYNTVLGKYGAAPHPLPGWLARDIVARHLACPSMLCILSIQDWLSIDESLRLANADAERVNIPANPRHYWRYRMHVDLEDLLDSTAYNKNVIDLVSESGR